MSEPTTKAERDAYIANHPCEVAHVRETHRTYPHGAYGLTARLIADIERRDAILRRLVEWEDDDWSGPEHVGADGDGPLEVLDTIIADARKELKNPQQE